MTFRDLTPHVRCGSASGPIGFTGSPDPPSARSPAAARARCQRALRAESHGLQYGCRPSCRALFRPNPVTGLTCSHPGQYLPPGRPRLRSRAGYLHVSTGPEPGAVWQVLVFFQVQAGWSGLFPVRVLPGLAGP